MTDRNVRPQGFTVGAYVPPNGAGDALLRRSPAQTPAAWLSDALAQLGDCEVILTVNVVGQGHPEWLSQAAFALEGGTPPAARSVRPVPALPAPRSPQRPAANHPWRGNGLLLREAQS